MIVYQNTKKGFRGDYLNGGLINLIKVLTRDIIKVTPSPAEIKAWENSLKEMMLILSDNSIDDEILIAIEYQIPATSKRIDFLVIDDNKMAIIELKQWQEIEKTSMQNVVKTYIGGKKRETIHPSYQVYTYARFIEDFNVFARKQLRIIPCVYMHNMGRNREFLDYEIVEKTEIFFQNERKKLIELLSTFKPAKGILEKLDSSVLCPSKSLIDSLSNMLKGNEEFILLDEQRVVYEKAIDLAKKSKKKNKVVYIVEGGPGSGKSVVAVNLLVNFTRNKKNVRYVTKNSAIREINKQKLKGEYKNKIIDMLFTSSGSFVSAVENEYDILIVDEAHRLNEKSGIFSNKGENQIKEIINAAKFSIFFIDEDQKVTFKDIGSIEEIKKWSEHFGAEVYEDKLISQFRCNGNDGYIAWLDNVLEIRETANKTLEGIDYDFKVFDKISDMYEELQRKKNSAIVAGYCWGWISKKENRDDIVIENFSKKWNLQEDGGLWLIRNPLNQVGCIHTIQGLECDYIGVIIGNDLIYDDGIKTQPEKRAKTDKSLSGYKKMSKSNALKAAELADKIIKNTYKVLMSRGMKGCYVYATDEKLREYLKDQIKI